MYHAFILGDGSIGKTPLFWHFKTIAILLSILIRGYPSVPLSDQ